MRITVTIRQVRDDGTEAGLDGELAAALEESAEQFAGLAGRVGDESRYLDHAERERAVMEEGRELQRRLPQATYKLDAGQEERAEGVSRAPPGSGTAPSRPAAAGAWRPCSGRSR